ncbi:MAG TPA: cytochrome P450 [Solirubrobacteraceae bacterium]|nr:cytochrome P450 [Solirubrobacteraceae bacterium]
MERTATDIEPVAGYESWPPDEATMRCPFDYFAQIREHAAVYRYPQPSLEGVFTYLITGFEECASVLTRADVFVNDLTGVNPSFEENLEPSPLPEVPTFYEERNIFFADGEDHRIKRGWGLGLFVPERLESFRPIVEREVDRLIDAFAADGRCDFRKQFSDQMPMRVVRQIIGLGPEADPLIKRLSATLAAGAPDSAPVIAAEHAEELREASMDLLTLCARRVLQRHEHPVGGDYVSELVQKQVARDGALDPNALAKHIMVTIFGADHVMGGHLADLAGRVARHAELQERLRGDRSLIRQFALETLRSEGPVPWLFRKCTADTVVGGVEIPAGARTIVATLAANLDPGEFPDPASFRIDRPNLERNQLSLGRGRHRCVGAPMARLQAEVTLDRMLDRLGEIRLDTDRSDLSPEPSFGFRVPTAVHLVFIAREATASVD